MKLKNSKSTSEIDAQLTEVQQELARIHQAYERVGNAANAALREVPEGDYDKVIELYGEAKSAEHVMKVLAEVHGFIDGRKTDIAGEWEREEKSLSEIYNTETGAFQ